MKGKPKHNLRAGLAAWEGPAPFLCSVKAEWEWRALGSDGHTFLGTVPFAAPQGFCWWAGSY